MSLEKIAVKKQSFEISHRYWSMISGLWTLGDNDVIIDKLNAAIKDANGDYAGNVEIIMDTCWLNYTPFAYLLVQPTCIKLIMKGDIYAKK